MPDQAKLALDEACDELQAHREAHGCDTGSACTEGRALASRVVSAQGAQALAAFLNEDDDE